MPLPPKKPQTGRVAPGKPAGKPAASSRRAAAPAPAAPAKNNLPLILGIAGGVVVILIILVVVFSGGEPKPEKAAKPKEAKSDAAKKPPPPDVSALEATGKSKCEQGQQLIQPRLSPDASAPKDRVFNDLEAGLKLMNEGLDAYKKAASIAGKKYPIDSYQSTRDRAIKVFCTELEREGHKSCGAGAQLIQSCASLMTGKELSDSEKTKLGDDLQKGKTMISKGMEMFSRASNVSGHMYETTQYQEALLVARKKLPELK